ncbi:MAG: ankyrin repeat domain-containing protein [Solirubrobacterales bacterium]|nr:ankyrin repeat domain-containing protein [Solirubrobacterales bacterium]MBV9717455.1 ankyrin repeat domain-containing protein [Solirubrobacterales bacterium]
MRRDPARPGEDTADDRGRSHDRRASPSGTSRSARARGREGRPRGRALLIELGFPVNAINRTAPLHEAAMRGNLEIIRLLLAQGADPNLRDRAYGATPTGWAEHHGQRDAQQLLAALEHSP